VKKKTNIVHELIHVLSTTVTKDKEPEYSDYIYSKVGIHYIYSIKNSIFLCQNRAVNEGITDLLAEKITGYKHNGYNEEKDICKLLSGIIGENIILQKYFENVEYDKSRSLGSARNIFQKQLIQKYGLQLGTELNDGVKKVLSLADQINDLNSKYSIYGLNEEGKNIRSTTREEISNILVNIIERVIDNESDFKKKFALIKALEDNLFVVHDISKISRKVQNKLINSTEFSYAQKVQIIRTLRSQGVKFDLQTIEDIIFNLPEAQQLNPEEKLVYGMELLNKCKLTRSNASVLCRLYVESGKISEEQFGKKGIFQDMLIEGPIDTISTFETIDRFFESFRYKKIGDYYAICDDELDIDPFNIFNKNGNRLMTSPLLDTNWQCTPFSKPKYTEGIDTDSIKEQLINKFEQYKVLNQCDCRYSGTTILKCPDTNERILTSDYIKDRKIVSEMFTIDDNGNLQILPSDSEWRRLTDDMSEIDIELQKQTVAADVSITEMMQEADSMQVSLSSKEPRTEENSIGEGNNGK